MTNPHSPASAACREPGPAVALADGADPLLAPVEVGGAPFPLLAPGGWFPAVSAGAAAAALDGGGAADPAAQTWDAVDSAGVAFLRGDISTAETLWSSAADGDAADAPAAQLGLALLAALRGGTAAGPGEASTGDAADRLHEIERGLGPDDPLHVLARLNRASALAASGRAAEGEAAAAEALRAARRIKAPALEAAASFVLALAALARGRRNTARTRLGEALRGFTREGDRLRMIQCHHLLGEIAYEAEDPIRAGSHYRDGLGIARAVNARAAVELLMLRFEHR